MLSRIMHLNNILFCKIKENPKGLSSDACTVDKGKPLPNKKSHWSLKG